MSLSTTLEIFAGARWRNHRFRTGKAYSRRICSPFYTCAGPRCRTCAGRAGAVLLIWGPSARSARSAVAVQRGWRLGGRVGVGGVAVGWPCGWGVGRGRVSGGGVGGVAARFLVGKGSMVVGFLWGVGEVCRGDKEETTNLNTRHTG